jgi:hypothetical protein
VGRFAPVGRRSGLDSEQAIGPDSSPVAAGPEGTFAPRRFRAEDGKTAPDAPRRGRVPGAQPHGDDYFLLEHKTAAQLDADYHERLWTDFQITIYACYVELTLGMGRVHALMHAEGLRRAIHHVYDRLKRNKALPDVDGVGVAVLDGHESHASYLRHCKGCLQRTVHFESTITGR